MTRLQSATCAALLAAAMFTTTAACGSSTDGDGSSATSGDTSKPAATVGDVPDRPQAADALRPWVADLEAGSIPLLIQKCWTVAPERIESMYADKDAILDAVGQPGVEGQFAYVWQDTDTRVSVKRSEIDSGYACPYVSKVEDRQIYTNADAEYRIFRYLQRTVGEPVNRDDTEEKYPLECGDLSDASRAEIEKTLSYQHKSMKVSGKPDDVVVEITRLVPTGTGQLKVHATIQDEGYCIASAD